MALHARSFAGMVKAPGFGMTPAKKWAWRPPALVMSSARVQVADAGMHVAKQQHRKRFGEG